MNYDKLPTKQPLEGETLQKGELSHAELEELMLGFWGKPLNCRCVVTAIPLEGEAVQITPKVVPEITREMIQEDQNLVRKG